MNFAKSTLATAAVLAAFSGYAQAATQSAWTKLQGSAFTGYSATPRASTDAVGDLVLSLAGRVSFDDLDAPGNTLVVLNSVAGAVVDGISYSATLSTLGLSYLSEATISFSNSAGDGVFLSPGFADDFSGMGTYSDSASLIALGLDFNVLSDGKLYVQFFESYDDNVGAADAIYSAGNVTFTGIAAAVPEPGTYALMAFGLAGIGFALRRRTRA